MEWAAVPATRARPSSVSNAPRHVLGRAEPAQAEAGGGERVRGHGAHRAQEGGQDLVDVAHQRGEGPRVGAAVRLRACGHVSSTLPPTRDGRPPSSGWAKATRGVSSRTPRAARSRSRKAGEARSSGCTAEQTSWRKPGSVSSAVRHPPPGSSGRLVTSTASPARARVSAADEAVGPGSPTTTASGASHRFDHSASVSPSSAPITGTGPSANRHERPLDLGVDPLGSMVEQRDPARPGHGARARPRTPPRRGRRTLRLAPLRPEVGVVDQQVDVAGQLEGRRVVLARSRRVRRRARSGWWSGM